LLRFQKVIRVNLIERCRSDLKVPLRVQFLHISSKTTTLVSGRKAKSTRCRSEEKNSKARPQPARLCPGRDILSPVRTSHRRACKPYRVTECLEFSRPTMSRRLRWRPGTGKALYGGPADQITPRARSEVPLIGFAQMGGVREATTSGDLAQRQGRPTQERMGLFKSSLQNITVRR
jgi:hypothetical protein